MDSEVTAPAVPLRRVKPEILAALGHLPNDRGPRYVSRLERR